MLDLFCFGNGLSAWQRESALKTQYPLQHKFKAGEDWTWEILNKSYGTPNLDLIYKTQLASIFLEPPKKVEKVFVDHDEVDYTLPNFGNTIFGMSEQMHCKETFATLDQYNHRFIDTKENTDSLFYNFALISGYQNFV